MMRCAYPADHTFHKSRILERGRAYRLRTAACGVESESVLVTRERGLGEDRGKRKGQRSLIGRLDRTLRQCQTAAREVSSGGLVDVVLIQPSDRQYNNLHGLRNGKPA
jgi:hypothetical protein